MEMQTNNGAVTRTKLSRQIAHVGYRWRSHQKAMCAYFHYLAMALEIKLANLYQ